MRMSLDSRREYLSNMHQRYRQAISRADKSQIIDEVVKMLGYNRKYAIQVLNNPIPAKKPPRKRTKPLKYLEALPAIQLVWKALDYPCAERLHPVLLSTAELLASHGELFLTPQIREQLAQISRSTLARRIAKWRSPKPKRTLPHQKPGSRLHTEVPIECYDWDENRPGALEVDLVEHNGGSSLGHFAYTITVVDVVTGYSRRRAILGRGQAAVFRELKAILNEWPVKPLGLHSDNGSEFLSAQLIRFCQQNGLTFTRSRPYRKNDNAHVEQKNRQFVREIVGYERYDTPEAVTWLNEVYSYLDIYVNLFLPMRKVVTKERRGTHVRKTYDIARTPFQRLIEAGVLDAQTKAKLQRQLQAINPLALHRQLEELLAKGSAKSSQENQAVH
ncbi:Integrase, catalytic core [Moorella glycerini]|uniref:Integrase core domain protein n=2 Tax=Neomoorella stamsii TaxID=1266720 RepID=A0A9X7J0M3_9FIRM|nr:Integrase core domain protein [Moorella stamsii]CEP68513.1 Integrase, catalytic core [Moorella glycerini]